MNTVDHQKTDALVRAYLKITNEHLQRGPIEPERVTEVLNALAVVTASTLAGMKDSVISEAMAFFLGAFRANLKRIVELRAKEAQKS